MNRNITAYIYRSFLLLWLFCMGHVLYAQQNITASVVLKVSEYNKLAQQKSDEGNYDESKRYLDSALKEKENAQSHALLCHINLMQNDWNEAVTNGEKCIELDAGFTSVYGDMFYAAIYARQWAKALQISEVMNRVSPKTDVSTEVTAIQASIESDRRSAILVVLLLGVVVAAFAVSIFIPTKNKIGISPTDGNLPFTELILACSSVSLVLWTLFYSLSHWIWSRNLHVAQKEVTSLLSGFMQEHDGAESFVLYAMMFLNIAGTLIVVRQLLKVKRNKNIYLAACIILLILSNCYFFLIGFHPPMVTLEGIGNVLIPIVIVIACVGIYFLYQRLRIIAIVFIVLLCAFASLLPYSPLSHLDLKFIFAPALRLLYGFKITDIYFQYDLYMSLLAALWLKYKWQLDTFIYISNAFFFLFLLGSLFFGERFFKTKGLSVIFIVALVITRIYAQAYDSDILVQVTPMRLDLWLIVLLIVNKYGTRHWLVGLSLGLMIFFHRNLGLIYTAAYVELFIILFLVEIIPFLKEGKAGFNSLPGLFIKHVRGHLINIVLLALSIAFCFVFFHELFSDSARMYSALGIGMMPISKVSFYWYVPIIFSSIAAFLLFYRERLGSKYVVSGFFIVLLAIGNSMYFFGRSHENNILNMCGVLVFALFLLFDILITLQTSNSKPELPAGNKIDFRFLAKNRSFMLLPFLFILIAGCFYSDRIEHKATIQYANLRTGTFHYPLATGAYNISAAKQLTNNSDKVYFLDFWTDFYYYYYSDLVPQGYYNPCAAWIYKKDLDSFMQSLLDAGYYVVYEQQFFDIFRDYVMELNYNKIDQQGNLVAIKKEAALLLLPDSNSIFHVGINGQLGRNGICRKPLEENEEFTIEAIIKPTGSQSPNATILTDLGSDYGISGMLLQANGAIPGQYIFGVGNGGKDIQYAGFLLNDNIWNYLVIEVNKKSIRIYNNGIPVALSNIDKPILRSNNAIMIGSPANYDRQFNGMIKEVRFSNGNLPESELITTAQRLQATLSP